MPTALVTGAAGFIGSHLTEELLARGWRVRGLDDLSTGSLANLQSVLDRDRFSFIEGDVTEIGAVKDAIDGVDHVFHQAAFVSVPRSFQKPRAVTATNSLGTATVVEQAVETEVDSLVLASSTAVYGDPAQVPIPESHHLEPASPYASSKAYAERIARQASSDSDLTVTILRYFNVYGPRQDPSGDYAAAIPTFIRSMLKGEQPVVYGDGKQTRDFVYVGDIVRANLMAVHGPGGTFNIGSGIETSVNDIIEILAQHLDVEVEPRHDDPRAGDIRRSAASIDRAREHLGFEPTTQLDSGLETTIDYFERM